MLNGLVTLTRVLRAYPADHPRALEYAQRVAGTLEGLVKERGAPVLLAVTPDGVFCDDEPLPKSAEGTRQFSVLLRSRGVRALRFDPGFALFDLQAVATWFAHDPDATQTVASRAHVIREGEAEPAASSEETQRPAHPRPESGSGAVEGETTEPVGELDDADDVDDVEHAGDAGDADHESPLAAASAAPGQASLASLVAALAEVDYADLADVRELVERLAGRDDAFLLFVRLLRAPLPPIVVRHIGRGLARLARGRSESWQQWALAHSDLLLDAPLFGALMRNASDLLAPLARTLLRKGPGDEDPGDGRARLVDLLVRHGDERALRLLVGGVSFEDDACGTDVLGALGTFDHPLAVSVLREVVHRCNTGTMRRDEARCALLALRRIGTDEARGFLGEVAAQGFLLPAYRRELRALAREVLTAPTELRAAS